MEHSIDTYADLVHLLDSLGVTGSDCDARWISDPDGDYADITVHCDEPASIAYEVPHDKALRDLRELGIRFTNQH